MSNVTIVTNNVPRFVVYGFELSEKEREEFDYLDPEQLDHTTFVRYKGQVYDLSEFMRIDSDVLSNIRFDHFRGWHGYSSDSFFSGVLVRYVDDDRVIIARYYS